MTALEISAPVTIPVVGGSLSLMGADEGLKWLGYDPYFGPAIGKKLRIIFPDLGGPSTINSHIAALKKNNKYTLENIELKNILTKNKDLIPLKFYEEMTSGVDKTILGLESEKLKILENLKDSLTPSK